MDGHVFAGQPTFSLFQLIILADNYVCCRRCLVELFLKTPMSIFVLLLCDSQNDKIMCSCPNQLGTKQKTYVFTTKENRNDIHEVPQPRQISAHD